MINDIKKDAETRMAKSVENLRNDLGKIRTGRANPGFLDHVMVDYYGNPSPLSQVASISVADSRTLVVTPWEKNLVSDIERAIINSDLGLNPSSAGTVIRVPMPALSEDRRKEMIRLVRSEGEGGKVAVRNIRRDANNHLKDLVKEKQISEDDERRATEVIQKTTDKYIAEIDQILVDKEKDLMEI